MVPLFRDRPNFVYVFVFGSETADLPVSGLFRIRFFSFLGHFRFRPSFVFGLLWFSAYPKLQQVFVSCKPSRILCVQPLKLRRARDQGRVSHWLRRNLSKLQSCEIPFAQRLRKLGPTSAARESALSSVA